MSNFHSRFLKEVISSLPNFYTDNYDRYRFGPRKASIRGSIRRSLQSLLSRRHMIVADSWVSKDNFALMSDYYEKFSEVFDLLSDEHSRELFVKLLSYWLLGEEKVKLPRSDEAYWQSMEKIESAQVPNGNTFRIPGNWSVKKFDLNPLSFPLSLYYNAYGIYCTFVAEQYSYSGREAIAAEPGDTVLDLGSCWGDTALYFAERVGSEGRVFGFEFVPSNAEVFRSNIELNPEHADRIEIAERAVWNESGLRLNFVDNGPGSRVSFDTLKSSDGFVETITIDDFVQSQELKSVDFIKMDIEGAELPALRGATKTIQTFLPKLAIAVYHSLDDLVEIPKVITSLSPKYKLYLDHFTINREETILFAKAD